MSVESKQKLIHEIQKRLSAYGIEVDDVKIDLDDKSQGYSDDEMIDLLVDNKENAEEFERILQNIEKNAKEIQKQKKVIFRQEDQSKDEITANAFEMFVAGPSEKTLKVLKKSRMAEYKRLFDDGVIGSQEELNILENALNLAYDVDLSAIRVDSFFGKLHDGVEEKSKAFFDELKEFEDGVNEYEEMFLYFQKTSKSIQEFEEKFNKYVEGYNKEHDGRTLLNQDKKLFKDKKELETIYSEDKLTYKKILEGMNIFEKSYQKLLDYGDTVKPEELSKVVKHLCCCDAENPMINKSAFESESVIYNNMERLFLKGCERQLSARQHYKDVEAKITNYKKVSHEREA